MITNDLVSIIIPTFNSEQFLESCFNSILKQTHTHLEVLLVDNASKDNTLEIIKSYVLKNSRFRLILNSQNEYAGGARNKALEQAKGEYVYFLDSDDMIKPNTIQVMLENIKQNEAQVAISGMRSYIKPMLQWDVCNYSSLHKILSKEELIQLLLKQPPHFKDKVRLMTGPVQKLYQLSFLKKHKILFPTFQYYEDVIFVLRALFYASRVSLCPQVLYINRWQKKSTMQNFTSKHLEDAIQSFEQINDFCQNSLSQYDYSRFIFDRMQSFYYSFSTHSTSNSELKNKFKKWGIEFIHSHPFLAQQPRAKKIFTQHFNLKRAIRNLAVRTLNKLIF